MKIKVLLVDDEKEFVELLAQRLESRNILVAFATDPDVAVEMLKAEEFDVVVLDLLMPQRSGIELLRAMKSIRPLTEIILLTGHGSLATATEGMKLGAFYYLMKPADIKSLMEKIARAFERKADQEHRIRLAEVERLLKIE